MVIIRCYQKDDCLYLTLQNQISADGHTFVFVF